MELLIFRNLKHDFLLMPRSCWTILSCSRQEQQSKEYNNSVGSMYMSNLVPHRISESRTRKLTSIAKRVQLSKIEALESVLVEERPIYYVGLELM